MTIMSIVWRWVLLVVISLVFILHLLWNTHLVWLCLSRTRAVTDLAWGPWWRPQQILPGEWSASSWRAPPRRGPWSPRWPAGSPLQWWPSLRPPPPSPSAASSVLQGRVIQRTLYSELYTDTENFVIRTCYWELCAENFTLCTDTENFVLRSVLIPRSVSRPERPGRKSGRRGWRWEVWRLRRRSRRTAPAMTWAVCGARSDWAQYLYGATVTPVMAGSNTNMEVIILSLTIYTLAHHPQWLTRREEAVREEEEAEGGTKIFRFWTFFSNEMSLLRNVWY